MKYKLTIINLKNRWHYSHLFYILFFHLICFNSCKKKNSELTNINAESHPAKKNDSIEISVFLDSEDIANFNLVNKYLHYSELDFINPGNNDTIITKKISRIYNTQVINYLGFSIIDGISRRFNHYYYVNDSVERLIFRYKKGDMLIDNNFSNLSVDDLYNDYHQFYLKIKRQRNKKGIELKKELDSIKKNYDSLYIETNNKSLLILNEHHYFHKLEYLYPGNEKTEKYLQNIKNPVVGEPFLNLIHDFIKHRINNFNFDSLNEKNHSKEYLEILSIGIFNFLKDEDNKGDGKYSEIVDWLKTMPIYKNDSIYIRKKINPFNNNLFKEQLNNLQLFGIKSNKDKLSKVLADNSSDFYLIDFWATWCKPCIEGVNEMKKLDIPKNVTIVSLSIDREKDIEKWKGLTHKLNQSITYWVNDDIAENKEFLNFIELQSIPRYLLIDKNMNLIDQAFYHPSEPEFLSMLKDIENHRFW